MEYGKTPCQCQAAGFCGRHGVVKTQAQVECCQRNPEYYRLWESRAAAAALNVGPEPYSHCALTIPESWRGDCVATDRDGSPADEWRSAFAGATVLLAGGGPSLLKMPLARIKEHRGVAVAAMNHAAAVLRPHLWFTVDGPERFHPQIWNDPAVCKWVFAKYFGSRHDAKLRRPSPDGGRPVHTGQRVTDCPNVWGYHHCQGWDPYKFWQHPLPTWGTNSPQRDPELRSENKSVMLPTLWMLRWLGFSRIVLIGCDFVMDKRRPYAFDPGTLKGSGSAAHNNNLFGWLGRRLQELAAVGLPAGLRIENATPKSRLRAFPRVRIDRVLDETPGTIETLRGLYS